MICWCEGEWIPCANPLSNGKISMTPVFADAIDIPVVLFFGIIVLVPLIAFEVFVEALVLKRIWHLPYGELCTFTFVGNFWSLLRCHFPAGLTLAMGRLFGLRHAIIRWRRPNHALQRTAASHRG